MSLMVELKYEPAWLLFEAPGISRGLVIDSNPRTWIGIERVIQVLRYRSCCNRGCVYQRSYLLTK